MRSRAVIHADDCTVEGLDPGPVDESAPDLRAATLSGVKWTSAARLLAELAMFAASIVLARLISPAEFGFTVVAVFVAAIGQSVAIQGIGSYLVQTATPSREPNGRRSCSAWSSGCSAQR